MSKLTAARIRAHDQAMALIDNGRPLTSDEVEEVYRNFEPAAEHNVGKTATFFTPVELALDFTIWCGNYPTRYVDLGAGIGVLSWALLACHKEIKNLTCVEINPTFVEIGRRLLPEAEWICADIFDRATWQQLGCNFDIAISNPPFGRVATTVNRDWLLIGPGHFKAMEIALRRRTRGA